MENESAVIFDEKKLVLRKGMIFNSGSEKNILFHCDKVWSFLITAQTHRIERIKTEELFEQVMDEKRTPEVPETISNILSFSPENMKKAAFREGVIREMMVKTYPVWEDLFQKGVVKPELDEAASMLGLSRKQTSRLVLRYLTSACDPTSLIDSRKWNRGRTLTEKNGETEDKLDELEYALHCFKRYRNASFAYKKLIWKYYMENEMAADGSVIRVISKDAPSASKVYRYLNNNLGGKTVRVYCEDETYFLNNKRPLRGNAEYGSGTIGGVFEVDEVEMDCYIVSENDPRVTIGKAIIYAAIDVFSHMIVAIKAGLKNNSYSGFCDLMLSLLEPHSIQAEYVGAKCDDKAFPSLVIPRSIRCDHGSEYESHALEAACKELGIQVQYVPVAAGSLKGLVENVHRRIQQGVKPLTRNAGFICRTPKHELNPKDYQKARETACLTLSDINKILIEEVCFLNTKPLVSYEPDLEMLEAKLVLTPQNIWNFEVERSFDPKNVTEQNRMQYLFGFMCRGNQDQRRFKVGRKGIEYTGHKLKYFCDEDWFQEMIGASDRGKAEIRYMDNTVSAVWVRYHNRIHKVPLAEKREQNLTLSELSWLEYDEMCAEQKIEDKHAQRVTLAAEKELVDGITETVRYAKAVQQDGNIVTGIPQNRAKEFSRMNQDPNETRNRIADPERPRFTDTPHEPTEEELLIAEIMQMTSDDEALYGYGQV